MSKRIGIVADSYKVPKFVEELTKKGYTVGSITPVKDNLMNIAILDVEESQVQDISNLCTLLERQFKSN